MTPGLWLSLLLVLVGLSLLAWSLRQDRLTWDRPPGDPDTLWIASRRSTVSDELDMMDE